MQRIIHIECACRRDQIPVQDEDGEDTNYLNRKQEIIRRLEPCATCGQLPLVS